MTPLECKNVVILSFGISFGMQALLFSLTMATCLIHPFFFKKKHMTEGLIILVVNVIPIVPYFSFLLGNMVGSMVTHCYGYLSDCF